MINKRLFGSDIDERIKAILEARQAVAANSNPNQSIQTGTDENGNPIEKTSKELLANVNFPTERGVTGYLSSKTPVARMWTSVALVENITNKDEEYSLDIESLEGISGAKYDTALREAKQKAKAAADERNATIGDSVVYYDKQNKKYILKNKIELKEEDSRIYTIGNYDLGTEEVAPNSSINELRDSSNPTAEQSNKIRNAKIFPEEHNTVDSDLNQDRNRFLKPQAGITSITSATEGLIGVMKKTTINFIVHNFHDFDNIYQRYFLRPGAQLFVDFGWDVADLYDPNIFFDVEKKALAGYEKSNFEQILYGETDKDGVETDGVVTKSLGNLETLVGIVTNYDSKILENGSVECMVEITSKNSALLGYNLSVNSSLSKRISYILDKVIYFDALYKVAASSQCVDVDGNIILYDIDGNSIEETY